MFGRVFRYDAVARALHWTIAALILLQVAGGLVLEELPRKSAIRSLAFDAHESIGIVVLALLAARVGWRLTHAVPDETGPRWQRLVARGAHLALYVLTIAVPIVGYATVDARGLEVAFFGAKGPDLLAADAALAKRLGSFHETLAWALVALVAVHVGAAAFHRFVLRDDVLARMLPPRGRGLD
jgi:cytochrome b561